MKFEEGSKGIKKLSDEQKKDVINNEMQLCVCVKRVQ